MTRRAIATLIALVCAGAASRVLAAQAADTLQARVEGRRLHMIAMGRGSPTVVLEAGFSSTSRTWAAVQRDLSLTHRTIAYDRAGLGSSEASPRARTARAIAEELHVALGSVGIAPPYILVGHSAGGLHVRAFAGLYPTEVMGLVLVDPAPEDFYARGQREFPQLFAHLDSIDRASFVGGSAGELAEEAAWEDVLRDARELEGRYQGPAIVLSSSRPDLRELGAVWTEEHRHWAARQARREYRLIEGAGHNIHRERADVVRDAVTRVGSIR
jgi:pimeloyl-ACP methyl ester carboxylesterase